LHKLLDLVVELVLLGAAASWNLLSLVSDLGPKLLDMRSLNL
jgi:hypothetical protein